MRRYTLSPDALTDLESQIAYLTDRGAYDAADRLAARVEHFLSDFICAHPDTGRIVLSRDFRETWVPQTRLVIWYRFDDQRVEILRIWHSSQNRRDRSP